MGIRSLLSIAILACICASCSKEQFDKIDLEGTWGATHYEWLFKEDGKIYSQGSEEYNPFNPIGGEWKVSVINTANNTYLATYYGWDKQRSKWDSYERMTWTVNGNRIKMSHLDGHEEEPIGESVPFKLTSETLVTEITEEYDYTPLINSKIVRIESYHKVHYRKMSDLSD